MTSPHRLSVGRLMSRTELSAHSRTSHCSLGTSGRVQLCTYTCRRGSYDSSTMCKAFLDPLERCRVFLYLSPAEMDHMWLHYPAHVAPRGPQVAHPGKCVDGYMGWFWMISHPYLILPSEGDPPWVPPIDLVSQPATSFIDNHPSVRSCTSCRRVTDILQAMIDRRMVTRGTEAYAMTEQALRIARNGSREEVGYQRKRKGPSSSTS